MRRSLSQPSLCAKRAQKWGQARISEKWGQARIFRIDGPGVRKSCLSPFFLEGRAKSVPVPILPSPLFPLEPRLRLLREAAPPARKSALHRDDECPIAF